MPTNPVNKPLPEFREMYTFPLYMYIHIFKKTLVFKTHFLEKHIKKKYKTVLEYKTEN